MLRRSTVFARAIKIGTTPHNATANKIIARSYGNFEAVPKKNVKGSLYDPAQEKDSCGVGLVANMKKVPSRKIVEQANEMLVRMAHRGGCGCEPNSGDGAGILVGMPDTFYRQVVQEELGVTLGPLNSYGTGLLFTPHAEESVTAIKNIFELQVEQLGMKVLGWRTIVTG